MTATTRKIVKPSGWKNRNDIFWMNDKGKTGVRYMCRECGKKTLGIGSASRMHFIGCSHGVGEKPAKQSRHE